MTAPRPPRPEIINFARCRRFLVLGPPRESSVAAFDIWMRQRRTAEPPATAKVPLRRPCEAVDQIAADLERLIHDLESEVDRLVAQSS